MKQQSDFENNPPLSYEQELWKKFQQGDLQALSTIYSIYFDQLYNYGSRFSNNNTLVEDCIQELFIKLIRNKANLSLPTSLKSYLFKSLRSSIFDHLERIHKYPSGEINDSVEFDLVPHVETQIISGEEAAEQNEKLHAALQKLTARQREALYLRYQEGLSYPEIAAMLSLTQKATYKLVGRAVQALRSMSLSVIILGQILNQ